MFSMNFPLLFIRPRGEVPCFRKPVRSLKALHSRFCYRGEHPLLLHLHRLGGFRQRSHPIFGENVRNNTCQSSTILVCCSRLCPAWRPGARNAAPMRTLVRQNAGIAGPAVRVEIVFSSSLVSTDTRSSRRSC